MTASKANLWFTPSPPVYCLLSGFREVATDGAWKHASAWSERGCHRDVLACLLNQALLKGWTVCSFLILSFQWRILKVFIILGIINVLSLDSKVSRSWWDFGCRNQTVSWLWRVYRLHWSCLESRDETIRFTSQAMDYGFMALHMSIAYIKERITAR